MNQWLNTTLGSVLSDKGYIRGPFGSALKRNELKESGIPVYEQKNAIEGSRSFRFFVDDDKFEELRRFQVRANDLIISCSGTVGKISVIRDADPKGIISQALLILRPNIEKANLRYLHHFLSSRQGFDLLTQASHGSVQINIAERKVVESIPILLPPLEEQGAIAEVLSNLDDKIDLLHRQNKTLEAMAETLFRQWFVEEAGEGWEEVSLLKFVELIGGGTPKTTVPEYWDGEIPWLSGGDISCNHKGIICAAEKNITREGLNNSSAKLLPRWATVITARGTVGKYALLSGDMAFSQSNYGILPKIEKSYFFTYLLVSHVVDELQSAAYGSVFDTITTATFREATFAMPPASRVIEFEEFIRPYFDKKLQNEMQVSTLESLRNTLLPKLMSGEVRVEV